MGIGPVAKNGFFHPLFDVCRTGAKAGNAVDHIDHQVEAVDLVVHRQLERGVDVALLLVTPHVEVGVIGRR